MICQCRLATLRTFLNGLAQVHQIETFPASSPLFSLPRRSAAPRRQNQSRAGSQTRGFHASKPASSQQQQQPEKQQNKDNDNVSSASGTKTPPKTKTRWRDLPPEVLREKLQQRHTLERIQAVKAKFEPEGYEDRQEEDDGSPRPPSGAALRSAIKRAEGRGENQQPMALNANNRKPMSDILKAARMKAAAAAAARNDGKDGKPSLPAESAAAVADPEAQAEKQEPWRVQKARLKEKFPEGWKPRKRLSPDALAGIKALNAQFPDVYTTEALATKFEIPAEAVRRILRSKWQPSEDEDQERQDRWHRRGKQIWETKAALGVKPPRKWRAEGITRDPSYHERRKERIQRDQEWEEEEIRKYREYRETLSKTANKFV